MIGGSTTSRTRGITTSFPRIWVNRWTTPKITSKSPAGGLLFNLFHINLSKWTLLRQLRVFLLYARGDQDAVHRLYNRIVKDGAKVWMDLEKLLPGQDWEYEIRKAIHQSDIVIVCLSRGFIKQGGYRHEELRIALEKANSRS